MDNYKKRNIVSRGKAINFTITSVTKEMWAFANSLQKTVLDAKTSWNGTLTMLNNFSQLFDVFILMVQSEKS